MTLADHMACRKYRYRALGSLKERDYLEYIGVDERIILKK